MRTILCVALLAALLAPTALAHGAPEAREIDLRVITDGTASGDYGGPEGALSDGAPDLLVLDVREATDAQGAPMLVFRFIHQLGDASAGTIGLHLTFDAAGASHAYDLATADGIQYTSDSFTRIDGPFDVGDGTPKAVEGWVPHAELGIKTGDDITNIQVTSSLDGTVGDRMPGTYDFQGITVPAVPPEDTTPGTYAVQGPANLIDVALSVNALKFGATESANLTITNLLGSMEQFVTLSTTSPAGITAILDNDALALAANETRTVRLGIDGSGQGEIALRIHSDLGAYQTLVLPLIGASSTGDDREVLSDDIKNGGSFQHTFTTVGTFDYHCHPHPWMTAKIHIEADDNATAPETHTVRIIEPDGSDEQSWRFEPANLTIQAGDTVAWVNEGAQIHVIMGGVAGDGHHGSEEGGHGPPGHHEEPTADKGVPGFEPLLLLAALAAALLARRS